MSELINDFYIKNTIIRRSLEYYDKYQPNILKFIDDIEYISFVSGGNITDQIIFYNKKKEIILESSFELLSIYIPETKIWKWSWSLPTASKKHTFITRKILDYAFDLDHEKDYLLKSTFLNSSINIINNIQLDICLSLSAKISKKPFILKYIVTPFELDNSDTDSNSEINSDKILIPYKQINHDSDNDKYINYYLLILDYDSS